MKTAILANRSVAIAGGAAVLAVAAMGFAGSAHARDNVSFSVGIGVPGVQVGVTNAYPVYSQPVYVPQPVYVQPAPVYVPRPVYVQPAPVYYQTQPVYVQPPYGRAHGWHRKHGHNGYYAQPAPGPVVYGRGYAPVYYGR